MDDLSILIVGKKTGKEILLPEWVRLHEPSATLRADYEDRSSTHGAVMTGDGKLQAREIILHGATDLFKTTAEHDDWFNQLEQILLYEKCLLIIGERYFYNVDMASDISPTFEDGWGRKSSEFEITLIATDPFKYAMSESVIEFELGSRSTIPEEPDKEIFISGADVYPVYEITVTGNSAANMFFRNLDDDDRTMIYKDPQMGNGRQVVINCMDGTVSRTQDGRKALNFFEGIFLRLIPGRNRLVYVGDEIHVKVTWRDRWAF